MSWEYKILTLTSVTQDASIALCLRVVVGSTEAAEQAASGSRSRLRSRASPSETTK